MGKAPYRRGDKRRFYSKKGGAGRYPAPASQSFKFIEHALATGKRVTIAGMSDEAVKAIMQSLPEEGTTDADVLAGINPKK